MKECSENNNEFFPVISKELCKNKTKQNPLYFVVSKFMDSLKSPDLKIIRVEEFNKSVYYIKFENAATHHIYSGYTITERHLTIHKDFKEEYHNFKNGLSPAHYTEINSSSDGFKQIVVHLYFDRQGFYKYIQIKEFEGKRQEGKFIELHINSHIENCLRENSKEVSDLLKKILLLKEREYQSIIESAVQIEKTLDGISSEFKKNSIKTYVTKAKEYIRLLQEANNYSYSIHRKRVEIMEKQIEFLIEKYDSLRTKPVSNDETNPALSENITTANQKNNKEKNASLNTTLIDKSYENILQTYRKLTGLMHESKKSPSNIHILIAEHNLIKEIQLKILTLPSIISSDKKEHLQKIINKIDLKNNTTRLKDIFVDRFWKGDLESIKLIYPFIEHSLDYEFYGFEIIHKLLTYIPSSDREETKLKSVFDYVYRKSEFFKYNFHNQIISLYLCNGFYYSILSFTLILDNLFAFKLILEYGANPNSPGMLIGNIEIPATYLIALFKNPEFIQEAIKHGAHYSIQARRIGTNVNQVKKPFRLTQANSLKVIKNHDQILRKLGFNTECLISKDLIEWLNEFGSFSEIKHFIPQFKFGDLLYALSLVSNYPEIKQRTLVPSSLTGYRVAHNRQELDKIASEMLNPSIGHVMIIFFSETECSMSDIIDKLVYELQCKFEFLLNHEPHTLNKLLDHLHSTNQNLSKLLAIFPEEAIGAWQFDAHIFLLLMYPPTFMTYQAIIQVFCFQAAYIAKSNPMLSFEVCLRAKHIADTCCFADELKPTRIYQYLSKRKKKYAKMVQELKKSSENQFSDHTLTYSTKSLSY
jgi:hypothetical protein